MIITKALGLWLFVVGVFWTFGFVWFHLSMMTITEPVLPLPLHLAIAFSGPAVLIVGSTMIMALWHTRIAVVLVLVRCSRLHRLLLLRYARWRCSAVADPRIPS